MNEYSPPSNGHERNTSGWFDRLAARFGFAGSADARTVIEEALADDAGEEFSAAEQAMLQKALRFGNLRVEDVCVPRAEIVAVEDDTSILTVVGTFSKSGYSRLPVYHDSLDNPVGMVHVKDVMDWIYARVLAQSGSTPTAHGVDFSLTLNETRLAREVIFAPPSMSALDLLVRMQARHIHLALIVDEHGGTDGLVSIEDLVEEIVGNIEDEHDSSAPLIAVEAGGLIADARADLYEVADKIGTPTLAEDASEVGTLGGLVFTMLGRVPVRGEIVHHPSGLEFEILEADRRRVRKLKVRRSQDPKPPEAAHTHAA
jgi:CBS domain containing-hemolysin-like protein